MCSYAGVQDIRLRHFRLDFIHFGLKLIWFNVPYFANFVRFYKIIQIHFQK